MSTVSHHENIVISDQDEQTKRLPGWAASFRLICRHLREEGHLDRLEQLVEMDRRADSFGLVDVALFFVAYYCAQPAEGGIREFWYELREVHDEIAALAGRRQLPSSSSVSRFLGAVDAEQVAQLRRFALGDASDLKSLATRDEAMWLDTHQKPWLFVDWDPKARLIRQRTLVDGEEYPGARRLGPHLGEPGQTGRKRGELKFVRGILAHAGSGQWLGGYQQPGNGTLVDEIAEVKRVKDTLDAQLGDRMENTPVMRVDGEGGEVPVINGVDEAGFVPLVRLKQYHLLERSDVWQAIEKGEPKISEGTGTGPRREVFEIGKIPLTSGRKVEQVHRWDNPIKIRLVVSRFEETDSANGAGKRIDGMRYEMFGTYLPADSWPCEAVVDAYFGRATVENRFAGADRELELDRVFCKKNPAGEHLATVVGLWVWNLMIELGDKLVEREELPSSAARDAGKDVSSRSKARDGCSEESDEQKIWADLPELDRSVRRRLEKMGMNYDKERGILVCARGHYLVPRKSGARDESYVAFRITGRACRGCPFRSQCTRSTDPDLRKETILPIEQAPRAVELREGKRRAPLGVEPPDHTPSGAHQVRRPGMLPARRRRAFKHAGRHSELEVEVVKSSQPSLYADAGDWRSHRRSRQRMTRSMRRRYYRLGEHEQVNIQWTRAPDLLQYLSGAP